MHIELGKIIPIFLLIACTFTGAALSGCIESSETEVHKTQNDENKEVIQIDPHYQGRITVNAENNRVFSYYGDMDISLREGELNIVLNIEDENAGVTDE